MSTNASPREYFDQLFVSLKEKEKCHCSIMFNANKIIQDDPKYVNLSEVFKHKDNYAFPSHLDGLENKSKILIALRISAVKSAFCFILRSSKSSTHLDKHYLAYLKLQCWHGTRFLKRQSHYERNYKARYSTDSNHLYSISMKISLCKVTNRWFLHNRKGQHKENVDQHSYHLHLNPSKLHSHISLFSEKNWN